MSDKILIVDDEEAILFAMRDYLTACGGEVDCAQDLDEAQALLSASHYAVVIADLRLTGLGGTEGLQLVSLVRNQSPGTRVVVLTAYGTQEMESEALRRGADAVLRKPKPLNQILQVVSGLVQLSKTTMIH